MLSIGDAFQDCVINQMQEQTYIDIYYFFKKSPLRWRLFKRQAEFLGIKKYRYKRPSGTRWLEHNVASLQSFMNNLLTLIAFCDQQIAEPHNKSMKDVHARIQGMRKNISNVKNLIYSSVKLYVLRVLRPVTKIMQDLTLLTSEFITMCEAAKENIVCLFWFISHWNARTTFSLEIDV